MVTEYEQGDLNLGCDDALPVCSPPNDVSSRAASTADPSNGPQLHPMEIQEPGTGSSARDSRVSDDLGFLDTSNGWPCGEGCCSLIQGGEKGPRLSPATWLARSLRTPCHGNRRAMVAGLVAVVVVVVVMVTVAIAISCCRGRTESETPVSGVNVTIVGHGHVVEAVLPRRNQTMTELDQRTMHTFLVRSLQYELRRLIGRTRFRRLCTVFQAVEINIEDGVFEYEFVCFGIKEHGDHFTHDLRSVMVDLLGAVTQAADLGIFVLDLASLQLLHSTDEQHELSSSSSEPHVTPVLIPVCSSIHYNRTCYPNVLHHRSQVEAAQAGLASISLLDNPPCSDHLYRFWCSLFVPDCSNEVPLPPCRSLCQAVLTDCPHFRPEIEQLLGGGGGCSILPDRDGAQCTGIPPEKAGSSQECHPVPLKECRDLGFTLTPPGSANLLGQTSSASSYWLQQLMHIERTTHCSPHLVTFACSVFYPQCTGPPEVASDRPEVVGPCEGLCLAVKRDCGFFFSVVGMQSLVDYNCSNHLWPVNQHTCAGTTVDVNSTADAECREDQFQCDASHCVSARWLCDGREDCANGSDEKDCAECHAQDNSFRCNNGRCLPLATRCDGHVDCLMAEDEVDCLRVSTEGDVEGVVEVYNPSTKHWDPICADGPLDDGVAEALCRLSRLTVVTEDVRMVNDSSLLGFLISRTNCTQHQRSVVRCNYSECARGPLLGQVSRLLALPRFGVSLGDGDWPWVVSLHGGHRQSFYCGGFLVTDQWVVTAAHCIGSRRQPDGWAVMAGHSRRTAIDPMRQVRSVIRLAVHPGFSAAHMNDDIALVLVDRPFRLGPRVRSLCLPDDAFQPTDGQTCYVGGWGKTSETDRDYSEDLRLRQLTVQPVTWCNEVAHALSSFDGGRTLCTTGRQGSDVCQGDSGGAVLCESTPSSDGERGDRRLVLAGVVSRGIECGHPLMPSVQTAVAPYADWIRHQLSTSR